MTRGRRVTRRLGVAAGVMALALVAAPSANGLDFEDLLAIPVCPEPAPFHPLACEWEPRPDSGQWLSLLAPIHETIVGTTGADALDAGAEGDVVQGLGGDDALTSAFNRTALLGDEGGDALDTEIVTGEAVDGVAVQRGGDGDDVHRASLGIAPTDTRAELLLDLGGGHDVADAEVYAASFVDDFFSAAFSNQILGGAGDDAIDAVADAQGFFEDSLAINAVDGGEGHDRITVHAVTEFDGWVTVADNRVSGGDGDDVVDASAIAWSNAPVGAFNRLLGGRGNDVMRAYCLTDSNVDEPIGINELWGDAGNDRLEAVHDTDGENWLTDLTTVLEGGDGRDSLHAESKAWGETVLGLHQLAGGAGDDTLVARFDLEVEGPEGGNFADARNELAGGPGVDRLEAWLTAPSHTGNEPLRGENHLDGGVGNDALLAVIEPPVEGASFLLGGGGNDRLEAVGGTGNVLDGGTGSDELAGGDGDDRLVGGGGADTYRFDPAADQGTDTVADLERKRDILSFAGLTDTGAPGLADDLDALSTITDQGPGNDVVVDLASGTTIVFEGIGTGDITSWADILPSSRIRAKKPFEPTARVAPALAVTPAAVEEAGMLPRDH